MVIWNPWVGCKKCSEGCKFCYIHKNNIKRDANIITKTKDFYKPIEKNNKNEYKIKSGIVYLGFSTDFLIEEADVWRDECFKMIKERKDLKFLFLTKRIDRFDSIVPKDWDDGYDNLIVGCTVENQKNVDYKLSIFKKLNIKHKYIICQPLLEKIDISSYLDDIELVVVGGESDYNARTLDYNWVLEIRKECLKKNVSFEFRQCGTHFLKDSKMYYLKTSELCKTARELNINL